MYEARPRVFSSTMITYAELIEWAEHEGPKLTLESLEEKKSELFPSLKPDFEEAFKQSSTYFEANIAMAERAKAEYYVTSRGDDEYLFKGNLIDIHLLKFVVERKEIEVYGEEGEVTGEAEIVEQADAGNSVTLLLDPNPLAHERKPNKWYQLIVKEEMRKEWKRKYAAEVLLKDMKQYLSRGSGGYGVSRATLNEYAESTFAGYCYPHAPKSVGAMVMVVTKMEGNPDSPHNQVAEAIKKHKAKDTTLDEPGSYLYQTLLQCNEKAALVQPMTLAVSGAEEPGLYCVENHVCPTPLFYNIGTEVYQAVLARAKPKTLTNCASFEDMWREIQLKKDKNLERSLGATMYAETLLYTTTADAGLRFKDRQSTKLSVAKRNKYLWEFVRLLEALNFFN